jgi:hypothetical protein
LDAAQWLFNGEDKVSSAAANSLCRLKAARIAMSDESMDKELRDALGSFKAAQWGDEVERLMGEEASYEDSNGRTLHAGEKTREEVIEFLVNLSSGLERLFEAYHAEYGCYAELSDFPNEGRIFKRSDQGEEEKN